MAFAVLVASGFILASLFTLDHLFLQIVLLLAFLGTGLAVHYQKYCFYLVFVFLFPLLPSQSQNTSTFEFMEFLFLCFAFWWAAERIRKGATGVPVHPLNPLLALFLLAGSLSVALALLESHYIFSEVFFLKLKDHWNILFQSGWGDLAPVRGLIYWFEGALFFYITIDVLDPAKLEKTTRVVLVSAVVVSFAAILQHIFKFRLLDYWIKENPQIVRVNSTFSDPNSLGTYLAAMLCLGMILLVYGAKRIRAWMILSLAVLFLGLLFSVSRAGWGAALLVFILAPAVARCAWNDPVQQFNRFGQWMAKRGVLVAFVLFGAIVLAALTLNYSDPKSRSIAEVVLFTLNPKLSPDVVLKGRTELWGLALSLFARHPIFGCGIGAFMLNLYDAPYFITVPENAHNNFLQILAETGVSGFILFVVILFLTFRSGRKALHENSLKNRILIYSVLGAFAAFLLTCLTGHPLLLLKLQLVFWALVAFLMLEEKGQSANRWFKKATLIVALILFSAAVVKARNLIEHKRTTTYEYGYHGWEKDPEGNLFRWTGKQAVSILPDEGEFLALRFRQMNPGVLNKPMKIQLFLNDQALDDVTFSDSSWKELEYYIEERGEEPATLRIVADETFSDPTPEGVRELGIAVGAVDWKCGFDKPIGVYELEKEGEKQFYWTTKRASFPLRTSGKVLTFPVMSIAVPVQVRFFWNHHLVKSLSLSDSEWQKVSLTVPANGPEVSVLTVAVSKTLNPQKAGISEDRRDLGVRIGWPFQWNEAGSAISDSTRVLQNARRFGITNNENHPVQLSIFDAPQGQSAFTIGMEENSLPRRKGLLNAAHNKTEWTQIYAGSKNGELYVADQFIKDVHFPANPVLLRMTAKGTIVLGEVPVASLRINDIEVARQPILFEDYTNYYFHLDIPEGRGNFSVEFLNDYYSPLPWMDRNLAIYEIAVASALTTSKMEIGWERWGSKIIIADFVDRDLPLQPRTNCYTVLKAR